MCTLRESDLVYINACVCDLYFVSGWGRGLRNTVIKQPLPPWTCPSDASSSSASSCLHCTKRPVSFHRRRLTYSLSPVSHSERVKPWITAHSRGTHTPEWQKTSASPPLTSLTCLNKKEFFFFFYTVTPVPQLDMYPGILWSIYEVKTIKHVNNYGNISADHNCIKRDAMYDFIAHP